MRLQCLAACVALVLAPVSLRADDEETAPGLKLLNEGDDLADKNDPNGAVVKYKEAFEKLLPGMRGIPFKQEVKRDVTAREDLQKLLIKEVEEEMTPQERKLQDLSLKGFGFIPRDMDFNKVMVEAYSEEIAAFYDPRTKTMHLIKEPEAKLKKQPSLLERALGKTGGFNKDENRTVIAHELTHALADQNHDLYKLQKSIKGDDDRQLALSSLIEGEATLTMMGAQMEDWRGSKIIKTPAADLDRSFGMMMVFMPIMGGKALREAPPILTESMMFPYLRGMIFCLKQTNDGGWKALDEAYRRPPLSTEQILHPEKYSAKPDAPQDVDLGTLDAGEGWTEVGRNVLGEMQLGVLLKRHGGRSAAAGWDGDRYAVFEGPNEKIGIVWATTWDTPEDADEFARGYARYQTKKVASDAKEPDAYTTAIRRANQGAEFLVERRGTEVVVIEGFPTAATDRLAPAAFQAKRSEKTYEAGR